MSVLFLDDQKQRHDAFASKPWDFVFTAEAAIKAMKTKAYDVAYLDHDLGDHQFVDSFGSEPTGFHVARAITQGECMAPKRVVVHSHNPVGAENIVRELSAAGIPCEHVPFFRLKESV